MRNREARGDTRREQVVGAGKSEDGGAHAATFSPFITQFTFSLELHAPVAVATAEATPPCAGFACD